MQGRGGPGYGGDVEQIVGGQGAREVKSHSHPNNYWRRWKRYRRRMCWRLMRHSLKGEGWGWKEKKTTMSLREYSFKLE